MRHLIHVGLAKAGSTFLQHWFAANPHIAYEKGGFAGFADIYDLVRQSASASGDGRLRVTSCEGLAAPHTSFGLSPFKHLAPQPLAPAVARLQAARTLKALFGPSQVLIVTRGFQAKLLSNYSQFVREGGALDMQEAFSLAERGIRAGINPFDIDGIVSDSAAVFGSENLVVLPFERLRDDPAGFLAILRQRLDLPEWEGPLEPVNEALSPEELLWYPRLARASSSLPGPLRRAVLRVGRRRRVARAVRPLLGSAAAPHMAVPASLLDALRGSASSLAGDPLYAPYAADYLL